MTLYEKIEKIQFDNRLNASEFIEKTRFSRGLYYSIKSGDKTELKPSQAKMVYVSCNSATQGESATLEA